MQSETQDPRERTHGQETAKSELPFKPMDGIRVQLKKGDNFTDDQAAAITMAMNDAIQLVLNRFDDLGQRFEIVEKKVDEGLRDVRMDIGFVRKDVGVVRKDLRSAIRNIVWPLVTSVLLGAIGIMATIHWS